MSADAVIMMIVAMLILWGGLAVAIVRLNRHEMQQTEQLNRDL